jgi:segregation and condensation protein A
MSDPKSPQQIDVNLEVFEGPLDLLLHLIKKNDLEIKDIPIAEITHEYLAYLEIMKDLNLELAGEFLVMASTLMQIKAHMLLPAPDALEDEGPDPRAELVNKLLEYQRFKEAAAVLAARNERAKDIYYRKTGPRFEQDDLLLRATTFDLLSAFKRVLDRAPREVGQIIREEITVETRIRQIRELFATRESMDFEDLFASDRRRIDLIVTFLALLELIRMKDIVAYQTEAYGRIQLIRQSSQESAPDDVKSSEEVAS